ncbi:MAG TPA: DedA family protein [Nitrosomonas sp.]|nr:DedA family protein [Nitrosomonas sp.]
MSEIINWIVETVGMLGYAGIVIMMFLESSFVPFPSEVVMIPAGYLAFKGEMNLMIAILCGIVGSLSGALFNYYLAIKLGRPLLIRYGTYVMFNEDTLSRMENFFNRHGHISTFIGRLIPVIRQYISLPAGLANMNLVIFSLYTSLGAGIWVIILALLGYYIGENEVLIKAYLHNIIVVLLLFCIIGATLYYWRYQKKQKRF